MAANRRIINALGTDVRTMLERRVPADVRKRLAERNYDAVGLVQTSIVSLFHYADVAGKASGVLVTEITGSCPQHIATLAFFGSIAEVNAAMQAIESGD